MVAAVRAPSVAGAADTGRTTLRARSRLPVARGTATTPTKTRPLRPHPVQSSCVTAAGVDAWVPAHDTGSAHRTKGLDPAVSIPGDHGWFPGGAPHIQAADWSDNAQPAGG